MEPRILICGNDIRLLETREIVLKTAFQHVTSALGVRALEDELGRSPTDLIVLCHSLGEDERRGVQKLVNEKWPASQMLVLAGVLGAAPPHGTGEQLSIYDGPRALLDRVRQMVAGVKL